MIPFFFHTTFKSQWVSGVRCQVQSQCYWLTPRSAGLSLYPWARCTGSPHLSVRLKPERWKYLAHNIMHRRSHQSPQCGTVSVTPAPASQDGSVPGGRREEGPRGWRGLGGTAREEQTIRNRQSACLSSPSATRGDFGFKVVESRYINERSYGGKAETLSLSCTSKRGILCSSRGVNKLGSRVPSPL